VDNFGYFAQLLREGHCICILPAAQKGNLLGCISSLTPGAWKAVAAIAALQKYRP